MIRVLVADDHPVVRKGVEHIITAHANMELVASCSNGKEALQTIRSKGCDVAVLDIAMPEMTGLEVLGAARAESLSTPIIILSMYEEEKFAVRAMRAGANAYITKKHASDELLAAIEKVVSGGRYVTETLAGKFVDLASGKPFGDMCSNLSDREMHVLLRLVQGERIKAIAAEMCLSPKTVSTYRVRVLEKLDLKTNADLVRFAHDKGLLE